MSLWVIQICDVQLTVWRDGEIVDQSPGVAVVDEHGVHTGDAAGARRFLEPRTVFDRFWQHLNEAPLNRADLGRRVRHHADLAYCHLKDVLQRCGRPGEAVLAVPPHYDSDELALLLGICAALDLDIAALVDAPTAALAGCAVAGDYQVVELFAHHATLTRVTVDDHTRRGAVDLVESSGLARIHSACADLIADAFLEQARFDPLHEAGFEQQLHDRLPDWLEHGRASRDVDLVLNDGAGRFSARLPWREFERVIAMVLAPLNERVDPQTTVVLRGSLAHLPGAGSMLGARQNLADDAVPAAVAEHRLALGRADGGVAYFTTLPITASATLHTAEAPPPRASGLPVTHLLAAGEARPLGNDGLGFAADGSLGPVSDGCAATVESTSAGAVLKPAADDVTLNGKSVVAPERLSAGDEIRCGTARTVCIAINVS